jgi:uncharacterized membrane protein YccC
MTIHCAYIFLRQHKFTGSHREFSVDYLGRRPRHYDDMICHDRRPSAGVMVNLGLRLVDVLQRMQQAPISDPRAPELDRIVVRIFAELRSRPGNLLPRRSTRMRKLLAMREEYRSKMAQPAIIIEQ